MKRIPVSTEEKSEKYGSGGLADKPQQVKGRGRGNESRKDPNGDRRTDAKRETTRRKLNDEE